MTLVLDAVAEPNNVPPRVALTLTEDDPTFVISEVDLSRDGVALRFVPTVTGSSAIAYDYDAPFDTVLTYRADVVESGVIEAWAESWADTSAWAAGTLGAGWSVAAGVASADPDGSSIYRDFGGSLTTLSVTSPTNVTAELLNSLGFVVATVQILPTGNVAVTAGTTSTVTGSGSFTLTVAGSSLAVEGSGWSTSVDFSGDATRLRLVAPIGASYLSQFGSSGTGNGQFTKPYDLDVDGSGNKYVTDFSNNRVQVFNSSGAYVSQFGTVGTGNGQFHGPMGIVRDGSGNLFVVDSTNNRVQKFNSSGVYQSKFGNATPTPSSANGSFDGPRGIAIDSGGNLWVVDGGNNRVQKFNSSGVYQSKFGTAGSGDGQFNAPRGITIDASDNIYVTESGNNRVQKFNSSGVFQMKFGSAGTGPGQFANTIDVAVDAGGDIWVTDTDNSRVQQFDSAGVYLSEFGSFGTGEGQFKRPTGIDVDATGNLWVTDFTLGRVQAFTPEGASVEDIVANVLAVPEDSTASDTAELTGITAVWLTNTLQPALALPLDDCSNADPDHYLTEDSWKSTVARSTSVQLDIEGSSVPVTVNTGPRMQKTGQLEVNCKNFTALDSLDALLANNAIINLRVPETMNDLGLVDGFYAVGDTTGNRPEAPRVSQQVAVQLPLTPSRPPAFDVVWQWNARALAQTGMSSRDALAYFGTARAMLIGPTF